MLEARASCPGFPFGFPFIQRVFLDHCQTSGSSPLSRGLQQEDASWCHCTVTGTSLLTAVSPGLLSDEIEIGDRHGAAAASPENP